jgi:hypothetical protein
MDSVYPDRSKGLYASSICLYAYYALSDGVCSYCCYVNITETNISLGRIMSLMVTTNGYSALYFEVMSWVRFVVLFVLDLR